MRAFDHLNRYLSFQVSIIILLFVAIALIPVIASANPIIPANYYPPFGSYNSSTEAIPLLALANFLPNLFWFSLLFRLTKKGMKNLSTNPQKSQQIFCFSIFSAVLIITIFGALIDFVFLYEKKFYFYAISSSMIKWIFATIFIAISVFLCSNYLIGIRQKQSIMISMGFAAINPLFWWLSTIGIFNVASTGGDSQIILFFPFFPFLMVLCVFAAIITYGNLKSIISWYLKLNENKKENLSQGQPEKKESYQMPRPNIMYRNFCAIIMSIGIVSTSIVGLIATEPNDAYPDLSDPNVHYYDTFTIAVREHVDSRNPYLATTDSGLLFQSLIYDTLTTVDEHLNIVPDLAQSWQYMNGTTAAASGTTFMKGANFPVHYNATDWPLGSIWEYNLKEDVYWNDGVPFSADDVVYTMNIQTGSNSSFYWAFNAFNNWIDHAEKVNLSIVRVFFYDRLNNTPLAVSWGDQIMIPIMPKHAFEGQPSTYIAQEWNGIPAIGTGPFKYTPPDDELTIHLDETLDRNPFFLFTQEGAMRGLGVSMNNNISIDRIIIKDIADDISRALSIKTGESDIGQISPQDFFLLKSDANLPDEIDLQAIASPRSHSKQVVINAYSHEPGYLNPCRLDPAVQRAIAIATNKTYINDLIFNGLGYIGYGLISPANGIFYWEPDDSPSTFNVTDENGTVVYSYTKPLNEAMEYDIKIANEILNAAGYVWSNESGMTVRKAGSIAAKRLVAMGIVIDNSSVLNKKLIFDYAVDSGILEDRQVGEFLVDEWEKIGVWVATSYSGGFHSPTLVNNVEYWMNMEHELPNTIQTSSYGELDPNYLTYLPSSLGPFGWNKFGTNSTEYNSFYLKGIEAFNYSNRKKWIDECSEWVYLSGTIIVTVYPKSCFMMNNEKFNMGDWTGNPGFCISNFWPENPLWSNLNNLLKYQNPFVLTQLSLLLISYIFLIDSLLIATTFRSLKVRNEKIQTKLQ